MPQPLLAPRPPLYVVFNPKSGRGTWPATRQALEQACQQANRPLTLLPLQRGQASSVVLTQAVSCALENGGIAVAAGGDGTINALAQQAVAHECAFGVLAQGTFNYFSRAQGLPDDPAEAVNALLAGHPQQVQVGMVNERVFLVNASLGLYARLLLAREEDKARFGRSRAVAMISAAFALMRQFRIWDLRMHWEQHSRTVRTCTFFVGNNALQFEQVGLKDGQAVEQHQLTAVALPPMRRWALFKLLVRALQGQLDQAPEVQSLSFQQLDLDATHGPRAQRIRIATDGELQWMHMPLRFQVSPQPLWLVKPPHLKRETA